MRAEQLRVELHPRTPWEAAELGSALVRRHAKAIWQPWLLITLPVFVVINALGVALKQAWLAFLLMWWLKPVFDRIPLFVLSRAVFGEAPRVRDTLVAQWAWGWRSMPAYLLWRRLGPARSLFLPVDLLEGGALSAQRRRTIGGSMRSTAMIVTVLCSHFELVIVLGAVALMAMFVPVEFMSESMRAAWALISQEPPMWVLVSGNALAWLASSLIEPFYIGAGFGMYLDRRTRLEAWDVEIVFRRLRARLATVSTVLCVVGFVALGAPQMAQAAPASAPATEATLSKVFPVVESDPAFNDAVKQAYRDPLLHPVRQQWLWVPNEQEVPKKKTDPEWLQQLGLVFGVLGEYGLWLLAAILAAMLVVTRQRWWPWLSAVARPNPSPATEAVSEAHVIDGALPSDIVGSVRQLWQAGRYRRALALLYRASVDAMVTRTDTVMVPGATEADCLRAARALPEQADRDAFNNMVRVWQYAAYAERLPEVDEFDVLLRNLSDRFGWAS